MYDGGFGERGVVLGAVLWMRREERGNEDGLEREREEEGVVAVVEGEVEGVRGRLLVKDRERGIEEGVVVSEV